jgi:hypothetical protein
VPRNAWAGEQSGKALRRRKREVGLTDMELAECCDVPLKTIVAWQAGEEPSQRYTPALFDALRVFEDLDTWNELYPRTAAQADRDAERAVSKADLSQRVASMDESDWQPVRHRGR